MIAIVLAAAVLLADSSATIQAPPAKVEAVQVEKAKDDSNTVVCHSEPVIGSRMPAKRCRTKGDIAAQKMEDRQALERSQIRTDPGH